MSYVKGNNGKLPLFATEIGNAPAKLDKVIFTLQPSPQSGTLVLIATVIVLLSHGKALL